MQQVRKSQIARRENDRQQKGSEEDGGDEQYITDPSLDVDLALYFAMQLVCLRSLLTSAVMEDANVLLH